MAKDTRRSAKAFAEALKLMPGGVNSPVRAFRSVEAEPRFIQRGKGSRVWDIDGNEYIDYVASWGPLILGHAHPDVVRAVQDVLINGTSFGAPTLLENEMACLIKERVPSVEVVRMVNSGTEATMSALRLARGVTGRDKILKFEGSYHGHADSLLIQAGSGVATLGLPDSPGVPKELAEHTIVVPYNDLDAVGEAFVRFGEEIAAVIVEPVAGNMGVVPPFPGFLQGLRKVTENYGALLIFDEVMTGFRVGYHCAQGLYGVTPDLTTLGKVIGGGLPVGAYGGKREIMEQVAPSGPVYQAGTLSGNPLAMAAGLATLNVLAQPEVYEALEEKGAYLEAECTANARETGIACQINRVGSMISLFFTDQPVVNFQTARTSNTALFSRYFGQLLEHGIYIPPSQFEGMFLSLEHSQEDLDMTLDMHRKVLKSL